MRLRLAVTLALFALARDAAAQQAIVLVRHAEKAIDSNEPEVPLSEAGRARAARLAGLLRDAAVTAIYATDTARARQTAEPLARMRKLEVKSYSARDPQGRPAARELVERLRKEVVGGVVLVVGHSNTVPELLVELGHAEKIEIPSSQFDDLFIVVPKGSGMHSCTPGVPAVVRLKY